MYEDYFGLSGAPFKLNPDPRFFFGSRSHNKAMAYLHYGVKQSEGFIVITGAVGAGKTMLIGHLLDQLDRSSVIAAQLLTSNIEPEELLEHILSAFRIEPEGKGRTGRLEAFEDYLFDQLDRGRRVLLIVDEAQNLPIRTLEELRVLSNIDYDGTPLFQVFLVGQPEFRDMLMAENLEQFKQRVIATYHLEGLDEGECREYIMHRLSVVGWKDDPTFSDDAFQAIYAETEGRPRRINTLANRLMLYCALEKQHQATGAIVHEVAAELRQEQLSEKDEKKKLKAKKHKGEAKQFTHRSGTAKTEENVKSEAATASQTAVAPPAREGDMKKKEQDEQRVPAASHSVFDRLREKRIATSGDAPAEATLSDVASAIAAASAGAPPAGEKERASEYEDASPAPRASQWRMAVSKSISEAQSELKETHANVKKAQQLIATEIKQQDKRRHKALASLSRAESIIAEIRETKP
jgi:putative secretion ATPase (PEP-CTERM system associated)